MCGRYGFIKSKDISKRFDKPISPKIELRDRYNVAPSQEMPVVTYNDIELMRWGLIPFWAKDEKIGYSMINARVESVATKPSYRKAFQLQRVIVPAGGFYEWKKTSDGKVPYWITLKNDDMFGFAGLFETWKDPKTGNEIKTYTILTSEPNEITSTIHDRMPVILRKELEKEWLNPDITEPDKLLPLLTPYPSELMKAYPVSTLVNKPMNDNPDLIKRIEL